MANGSGEVAAERPLGGQACRVLPVAATDTLLASPRAFAAVVAGRTGRDRPHRHRPARARRDGATGGGSSRSACSPASPILLDVDHPDVLGSRFLRAKRMRPVPHFRSERSSALTPTNGPAGTARRGFLVGVTAHLARDLATGTNSVPLLWPLSRRGTSPVRAIRGGFNGARRGERRSEPHEVRRLDPASGAAEVDDGGRRGQHLIDVEGSMCRYDHRAVRAIECLLERNRRELELAQLRHVRVVVDEIGPAVAQQREDLSAPVTRACPPPRPYTRRRGPRSGCHAPPSSEVA